MILKQRWSKVYESSEEELLEHLVVRGVTADRVNLSEFETASYDASEQRLKLWCAEGSATLKTQEQSLSMQPGDTFTLPANVKYSIDAGIAGCGYYRAIDR